LKGKVHRQHQTAQYRPRLKFHHREHREMDLRFGSTPQELKGSKRTTKRFFVDRVRLLQTILRYGILCRTNFIKTSTM
jgi:hypothetical protein